MQPYFLPYLGYWQLVASVDELVVYDTAQYVRSSWMNRNRIRLGGEIRWLTLPVEHAAHRLPVNQRRLAPDDGWRDRLVRQVEAAYRDAPYREAGLAMLTEIVRHPERNLAAFLVHALRVTARRLALDTPIRLESELHHDRTADRESRVLAVCREVGATDYLNLSGGRGLYTPGRFAEAGIILWFRIPSSPPRDPVSHDDQTLSILDLVMRRDAQQLSALVADSAWTAAASRASVPPETRSAPR